MKPLLEPMASESTTRELIYPWVPVTKATAMDDVKIRLEDKVFVDPLKMTPVTVEYSWAAEIYVAEPRPATVLCLGVEKSCRRLKAQLLVFDVKSATVERPVDVTAKR